MAFRRPLRLALRSGVPLLLIMFCLCSWQGRAQNGLIRGRIYHAVSNESISFANVLVQETQKGAVSDERGLYVLDSLSPGVYTLTASAVGYELLTVYEIEVSNSRSAYVDFALRERAEVLEEVGVSSRNTFYRPSESPLSLKSVSEQEIKRAPGGLRDVSVMMRSLPGVTSSPSFRNDVIIRGGAPSENVFYLDGIATPIINHFQTQGASGGPVGIFNVDLISEVFFHASALPVNRESALSALFDFRLKEGRKDRWALNGVVGTSDLAISSEGPISKNSSLILSVRRSYLQFVFRLIGLPFLPVYNDAQFKYKHYLSPKSRLTVIGIGALDNLVLNPDAITRASTREEREVARLFYEQLPVNDQWNYTTGAKYEHSLSNSLLTAVVSRNHLNNRAFKYAGNDESTPDNLVLDYTSQEIENRVRVENYWAERNWEANYGVSYVYAEFLTNAYAKEVNSFGTFEVDYDTRLGLHRMGLFGQASRKFMNRLTLSLGLRLDGNSFFSPGIRLFSELADQFSPRLSGAYALSSIWDINIHTGRYHQLPPYPMVGYQDTEGAYVNRDIAYIRATHYTAGVGANLLRNARLTLEGFYKAYDRYPFSVDKGASMANFGADFGVYGNEEVTSTSVGRSYGMEFSFQQKAFRGLYGLLAYTLYRSEFQDVAGTHIPSAWDYRQAVSLTGGQTFVLSKRPGRAKRDLIVGLRWLYTGAAPYTPYDIAASVRKTNWDISPSGLPDYTRLNTRRLEATHQLDVRVDLIWYFQRWNLHWFLDITNAYNQRSRQVDILNVQRDELGNPLSDPNVPGSYQPWLLGNEAGTLLPRIGTIIEF